MLPYVACSRSLSSQPICIITILPKSLLYYVTAMATDTGQASWRACLKIVFTWGFSLRTTLWWSHLKDQPHTTLLDLLRALLEQAENDAMMHTRYSQSTSMRPHSLCPSQQNVTTDNPKPTRETMVTQSARLNWMLSPLRQHRRSTFLPLSTGH